MEGALLPVATMSRLINSYFLELDPAPYHRFKAFDWASLDRARLGDADADIVAFITFIEDHIPGYFAEYDRLFPVEPDRAGERFAHNRELWHFVVKWAQEEDGHAHILSQYQIRAGLCTEEALRTKLSNEGRKKFLLPVYEPIEFFTYTLIQEKATQLFYQRFAGVVQEPLLVSILKQLVRDESRHFVFFSRIVAAFIEIYGAEVFPHMLKVLKGFQMPLANTLSGYWRWSLRIADAVGGYDHTAAYAEVLRVVQNAAEPAILAQATELLDYVNSILRVNK